jgi:hypothetical protein
MRKSSRISSEVRYLFPSVSVTFAGGVRLWQTTGYGSSQGFERATRAGGCSHVGRSHCAADRCSTAVRPSNEQGDGVCRGGDRCGHSTLAQILLTPCWSEMGVAHLAGCMKPAETSAVYTCWPQTDYQPRVRHSTMVEPIWGGPLSGWYPHISGEGPVAGGSVLSVTGSPPAVRGAISSIRQTGHVPFTSGCEDPNVSHV